MPSPAPERLMNRLMARVLKTRELSGPSRRPTNMNSRFVILLVALAAAIASCGSSGTATGDTLPTAQTADTEAPIDEVPGTDAPIPITQPTRQPGNVTDPTVQTDLDTARDLWSSQGPDSYTIVTQSLCFCPQEQWSDTIVDGVVTEHIAVTDDVVFDPAARPMDALFEAIQQIIDNGYASFDVSYDSDTGAVQQFFVDIDELMADEEYGVEVISVEPLN